MSSFVEQAASITEKERNLQQDQISEVAFKGNKLVQQFIDELVEEQLNSALNSITASTYDKHATQELLVTSTSNSERIIQHLKNLLFLNTDDNKCRLNMSKILTVIFFIYSIIHSIRYALLVAKTVTIREAAPPVPFFKNTGSIIIKDFYDGSIDSPALLMARAEFTVVMLYAPWEFRSKQFRRSYFEVARFYHHLPSVKFVAANCHYYRGKCCKMYKLLSYPVIFAYTPYGLPIVFNQVLSSDRLFTWIQHLLCPLDIIQSTTDYHNLTFGSDFSVIGYFTLQHTHPLPHSYNVLLNTAYKFSDAHSILHFGVLVNKDLAMTLRFSSLDQLHFYSFTGQNIGKLLATFQIYKNTKTQDIVNWINECIHEHQTKTVYEIELEDIENPGKSETLFHQINSSVATVVLFTNMLGLKNVQSLALIQLKNLVRLFHFCLRDEADSKNINSYLKFFHPDLSKNFLNQNMEICKLTTDELDRCCKEIYLKGMCQQSIPNDFVANDSNCSKIAGSLFTKDLIKRRCCIIRKQTNERISKSSHLHFNWKLSMACQFMRLLHKEHPKLFKEYFGSNLQYNKNEVDALVDDDYLRWIIGAGCRLNKTIGFLTMDKRFGRHFMQKWGLPEEQLNNDSVAIVSRGEERIYWMDEEVNLHSLIKFFKKFLNGNLKWKPINEYISLEKRPYKMESIRNMDEYSISSVEKINLQIFNEEIVIKQNRSHDAIVFFSGGDWHGPSRVNSHYLHQIKFYFYEFDEFIKFYIIDTSKNTLPWSYRFDHLPTLVFFPARNPQESFTFPNNLAFTVPNLLAFILPRCQDRLRWRLTFAVCNEKCLVKNYYKMERTVHKLDESIRILRSIIRSHLRRVKTRVFNSVVLHNLRLYLRKRQLQKTIILQMQTTLQKLRNCSGDELLLERSAARDVELITWLLNNQFGLNLKYS